MARLLGIRADDVTVFARWLLWVPKSLPALANAEPEGWGLAMYDARTEEWSVERRGFGVTGGQSFAAISPRLRGSVLVAHLRARADLAIPSATTQPIRRAGWVIACDGTIENVEFVRHSISPRRLRECADGSPAELLLAFFLTRLDIPHYGDTDGAIRRAVSDLAAEGAASTTFILSNGNVLYGFRGKSPLHLVEEVGGTRVPVIASEPLSDGPWRALDDGSLVRVGSVVVFLSA